MVETTKWLAVIVARVLPWNQDMQRPSSKLGPYIGVCTSLEWLVVEVIRGNDCTTALASSSRFFRVGWPTWCVCVCVCMCVWGYPVTSPYTYSETGTWLTSLQVEIRDKIYRATET